MKRSTRIRAAAPLQHPTRKTGRCFCDNDGHLDLFVCRYLEWNFTAGAIFCGDTRPGGRSYCHPDKFKPVTNCLYKNNGDGTFTDVSQASQVQRSPGKALGVAFADFNQDGFPDISVANDSFPQSLFKNNGNSTFTEVGTMAGVSYTEDGKVFAGMGTEFADLDNDGLPDIITTALPYQYYGFFQNRGNGRFAYLSLNSRLGEITRRLSGWGIHIFDYDNDGRNDVFLANSHVMDNIELTQPHLRYPDTSTISSWTSHALREKSFLRLGPDYSRAVEELTRARSINPRLPSLLSELGYAWLLKGEKEKALPCFIDELSLNPDDFSANAFAGWLLRESGQLPQAQLRLKKALTLKPDDPGVLFQMAQLAKSRDAYAEAAELLERVITLRPNFTQGHVLLAQTYYRLKRSLDTERERAIIDRLNIEEQQKQTTARERLERDTGFARFP